MTDGRLRKALKHVIETWENNRPAYPAACKSLGRLLDDPDAGLNIHSAKALLGLLDEERSISMSPEVNPEYRTVTLQDRELSAACRLAIEAERGHWSLFELRTWREEGKIHTRFVAWYGVRLDPETGVVTEYGNVHSIPLYAWAAGLSSTDVDEFLLNVLKDAREVREFDFPEG